MLQVCLGGACRKMEVWSAAVAGPGQAPSTRKSTSRGRLSCRALTHCAAACTSVVEVLGPQHERSKALRITSSSRTQKDDWTSVGGSTAVVAGWSRGWAVVLW